MGEVSRHTPLPATSVSSSVPQSEAGLSPSVATCKTVFYWDGCFLLYSWHPGKRSHLQNCLIWMLGRQTHTHTFERSKLNCTQSHICARLQTLFFFLLFLPQRRRLAGALLLLMMKSGSDSATLCRVDALQHGAAMLRKFSVSPHWEHGDFSSSLVHQYTSDFLPPPLFHLWSFLMTFALCSRGHFNGIIASPVVFSARIIFYFFSKAEWQSISISHVCVRGFACALKQSNLLRLDQKKGSLGKLPGSGRVQGFRAHAQFGAYLFFAVCLFAVAEGLRVGIWCRVGWGEGVSVGQGGRGDSQMRGLWLQPWKYTRLIGDHCT